MNAVDGDGAERSRDRLMPANSNSQPAPQIISCAHEPARRHCRRSLRHSPTTSPGCRRNLNLMCWRHCTNAADAVQRRASHAPRGRCSRASTTEYGVRAPATIHCRPPVTYARATQVVHPPKSDHVESADADAACSDACPVWPSSWLWTWHAPGMLARARRRTHRRGSSRTRHSASTSRSGSDPSIR